MIPVRAATCRPHLCNLKYKSLLPACIIFNNYLARNVKYIPQRISLYMPYEYLEDVAMADVAFHAWSRTLDGLLCAAGDAMLGVMVEDPGQVEPAMRRKIAAEGGNEEMLLYSLLEELLYQKDAGGLLLRLEEGGSIEERGGVLSYEGMAAGEPIDANRHSIAVDVKAVTMHMFSLYRREDSWHCTVVLDI